MEKLRQSLALSKITLGTMRFFEKGLSTKNVTNLIDRAFELGIDTHHTSYEYSSYGLYLSGLKKSQNKGHFKNIVKLSSPHFEDPIFDADVLEKRVDNQLVSLNVDTIDVLQWLLRSKPINDFSRLKTLENQKNEISETFYQLKKKGKVKAIFSFPYSVAFTEEVLKIEQVDGITSYLNKSEKEFYKYADQGPFIGIRPFFASKLLHGENRQTIKSCLDYTFKPAGVLSIIAGINNEPQLNSYENYLSK